MTQDELLRVIEEAAESGFRHVVDGEHFAGCGVY